MSNTCETCGTAMKPLFTSSYCPNDCKKPHLTEYLTNYLKVLDIISRDEFKVGIDIDIAANVEKILQDYAAKKLQDAVDKYCIKWLSEALHVPSNLIYPWSGDDFPIG